MKVLSLFDGISCGRVALERSGIKINAYYASEIDKYAIMVSNTNYSDIIRLGDIKSINIENLPNIDLVIGGSPCQGFSFAGKRLNFNDPRSALFFEYVRILNEIKKVNPEVKFLLENVNMKQEYQDIISSYLGVEPIVINSSLVSAQIRRRLYWTNISDKIIQPTDKELYWDSVQIDDASGVMYYSKQAFEWIFKSEKRKQKYKEYHKNSKVKMQMLEASHHKGYSNQRCFGIIDKGKTRYIHPIECERLQGLPDNYTCAVSNTQRYKMLGNGWNVDTIAHIFSYLKADQFIKTERNNTSISL